MPDDFTHQGESASCKAGESQPWAPGQNDELVDTGPLSLSTLPLAHGHAKVYF
jgi:hypothetical protein